MICPRARYATGDCPPVLGAQHGVRQIAGVRAWSMPTTCPVSGAEASRDASEAGLVAHPAPPPGPAAGCRHRRSIGRVDSPRQRLARRGPTPARTSPVRVHPACRRSARGARGHASKLGALGTTSAISRASCRLRTARFPRRAAGPPKPASWAAEAPPPSRRAAPCCRVSGASRQIEHLRPALTGPAPPRPCRHQRRRAAQRAAVAVYPGRRPHGVAAAPRRRAWPLPPPARPSSTPAKANAAAARPHAHFAPDGQDDEPQDLHRRTARAGSLKKNR